MAGCSMRTWKVRPKPMGGSCAGSPTRTRDASPMRLTTCQSSGRSTMDASSMMTMLPACRRAPALPEVSFRKRAMVIAGRPVDWAMRCAARPESAMRTVSRPKRSASSQMPRNDGRFPGAGVATEDRQPTPERERDGRLLRVRKAVGLTRVHTRQRCARSPPRQSVAWPGRIPEVQRRSAQSSSARKASMAAAPIG